MTIPVEDTGLRCLECEYNLTGVQSERCPECGWQIDHAILGPAEGESLTRANTQRFAQGILCAFVGIAPFVLFFKFSSLSAAEWRQLLRKPPELVLMSTTLADSILLFVYALYLIPKARSWPRSKNRYATVCRMIAIAQVLSAGFIGFQCWRQGPLSAVLSLFAFAIISIPGWVLLLVTATAFSSRKDRVLHLRAEQSRRLEDCAIGAPFVVHAAGHFTPQHIKVSWDDAIRETNAEIEALIDSAWQEKTREAEQNKQTLYNGEVGRLVRWSLDGGQLILRIGVTDYRDFVGTNIQNAHLAAQCCANPLGTSATVITADGCLLYGRRGQRVASHAGWLHTFGGMLEPPDRAPGEAHDVFAAVRRELREELRLSDEEITDLVCTGLVRDGTNLQPELLFDASVGLTKDEVLARFDAATDEEHTAIEACLDEPDAILPFIKRSAPVVPVAQAAMMLHGMTNWGLDWFENISYVLFGDLPEFKAERDDG